MRSRDHALRRFGAAVALAGAAAAVAAAGALAAAPTPKGAPQIEGNGDTPFVGDALTATNGLWSGAPTSYTYAWKRCDTLGDRRNCVAISGATAARYVVQKADVGHTLSVVVTAHSADGSASQDSKGTGIVSDKVAPKLYVRPQLSGDASVGSTLTGTAGTWAGATSFTMRWQQCDPTGAACTPISGATGRSYGVRTLDVGHTLRLQVTASNTYGTTKSVTPASAVVTAGTPSTSTSTTVVTTTVAGNRPPTVAFLSLKRIGNRIYARFRICDDSSGRIRIVERDHKARQLAYTRRLAVSVGSCGVYARHWLLLSRYRKPGRFVVTLRAEDRHGALSRLVSRGLTIRR